MFRVLRNLVNQFSEFLETLSRAWQDARVPLSARLMLLMAPIYWLCPYDFNPDFLPGGYADDLWIVPMLFVVGTKLVPRVVIQDARKAAAQAVCGILCMGLVAVPAAQHSSGPPAPLSKGESLVSHCSVAGDNSLSSIKNVSPVAFSASIDGKPILHNHLYERQNLPLLRRLPFSRSGNIRLLVGARLGSQLFSIKSSLLTVRGGQFQLYGADADLADTNSADRNVQSLACNFQAPNFSPSAKTGGFLLCTSFITHKLYRSVEKATC